MLIDRSLLSHRTSRSARTAQQWTAILLVVNGANELDWGLLCRITVHDRPAAPIGSPRNFSRRGTSAVESRFDAIGAPAVPMLGTTWHRVPHPRRSGEGDNREESPVHMQSQPKRAYKEITLQQLRSFCETVRLGSLTAAADSLGLARPTVWKQVHALEDYLGIQLVEPHARGCEPTEAGRMLADQVSPLITGIASLRQSLQSGGQVHETQLTVAASSRLLVRTICPPASRSASGGFPTCGWSSTKSAPTMWPTSSPRCRRTWPWPPSPTIPIATGCSTNPATSWRSF